MNDTSSSWFAGDFAERSTIVWEQMVASYSLWSVALPLVLIMYALSLLNVRFRAPTAPLIGLSSAFETRYTANWRFFRNAAAVLDEGFSKFSNSVWRFARADADMLMLPSKYVPELQGISPKIASPTIAHAFNLSARWTNMDIILKNNLHFRTLQEKLTPNLNHLTSPMQDELDHAVDMDLPECEYDWVAMKPYHTVLRLVSRISARIFLGKPLCRDERWLEISTEYTENVFVSLVVLRLFPRILHGVVAYFLPSTWISCAYIRKAKRLIVPEINRRRFCDADQGKSRSDMNLLDWMLEIASPQESNPADLAHLEVVMSLASIHTSQMNAVHVLFDLAAHPQYVQELRDEIQQVLREDGAWRQWTKSSFSKLKKLDSFMRESQRHNPPTLLSYHRVMMQDHVLNDGTLLPQGAHIAMPVNAIQNSVTPDAATFDPMRYYNLRQLDGQRHLHQFVTTEKDILNFGHGKYACPGRFFAALEIKIILVRLIMDYDWKLPEGQGRPANLHAHEFIFPNQKGVLYMKARPSHERLSCDGKSS